MGIGSIGSLTGFGTGTWEDWLRGLMQRQQQESNAQLAQRSRMPTTAPSGSGTASMIPRSPSFSTSAIKPTNQAPRGGVSTTSSTAPRPAGSGNPQSQSVAAAAMTSAQGQKVANQPKNTVTPIPKGHFFSGMDQTMLDMLRDNPDQTTFEYLKSKGYSPILQSILGRYDPLSIARIMGTGFGADSVKQLMGQEGVYNTLMGGQNTIDPRALVSAIAGTHYGKDTPANSLGFYLDSTKDVDPNNQVKNLSGIILSALQGIVPDDALKAYANLLNRQALQFVSERMHDKGHYGRESFLDYMRRMYPGQGLGFY